MYVCKKSRVARNNINFGRIINVNIINIRLLLNFRKMRINIRFAISGFFWNVRKFKREIFQIFQKNCDH